MKKLVLIMFLNGMQDRRVGRTGSQRSMLELLVIMVPQSSCGMHVRFVKEKALKIS